MEKYYYKVEGTNSNNRISAIEDKIAKRRSFFTWQEKVNLGQYAYYSFITIKNKLYTDEKYKIK